MTSINILKKLSIPVVAILALGLTRTGISYFTILIAIGILLPIICGSKKSAVFTGILYATLSYILTYPSSTFLINYMPSESIPLSVSTATVYSNIFMGWIIPVIIAAVVCGVFSIIGQAVKRLFDKILGKDTDEHHFRESDDSETIVTDSYDEYPEYSFNNNSYDRSRNRSFNDRSFGRSRDYSFDEDSYEMGRDYSFDGNFHGKGRYNSYNDNSHGRKRDYTIDTSSLDKKEKKELLYMTPIQKAKNRKKKNRK